MNKNGTSQWQDPRLCNVALPCGWEKAQDQVGILYWRRIGREEEPVQTDPRLTYEELTHRGIPIEKLIVV